MEIALWSPGRGGRLKSAHQSSPEAQGSCSVLGAQRPIPGREHVGGCFRAPPLTGGCCSAGPSPSVMARLCCPGREGGRQVAVLLKATRTAFERGTHPCTGGHHTDAMQLPPHHVLGTLYLRLFCQQAHMPPMHTSKHLVLPLDACCCKERLYRAVPVLAVKSLQRPLGCAGHRGVVDAHEAAQEVQQRVMVLFQLLEDVLVTLRDSHSRADLSGAHRHALADQQRQWGRS